MGFRVYSNHANLMKWDEICVCPCSKYCQRWLDLFELTHIHDKFNCNARKPFRPNGLLKHCQAHSKKCIFHFLTYKYLIHLYSKWWKVDNHYDGVISHYGVEEFKTDAFHLARRFFYKYAKDSPNMFNLDSPPQEF